MLTNETKSSTAVKSHRGVASDKAKSFSETETTTDVTNDKDANPERILVANSPEGAEDHTSHPEFANGSTKYKTTSQGIKHQTQGPATTHISAQLAGLRRERAYEALKPGDVIVFQYAIEDLERDFDDLSLIGQASPRL